MFSKILIANRGEIACRVAATAHRMGIRTVAVFSEADATARHVSACDEAVLIGPAPARESYLVAERMIEVALETGAQAIHPGYGFLSENADFASACTDAGLVFIGPPASAIRAMGSKSAAKALMEQAGVPLVPGYHGENQDPDFLLRQAEAIGYPILLKASAGGGGKGMRVVDGSIGFKAALESCQREAGSSFGDPRVLLEKYLLQPRHIEIQLFADSHGQCVYLFERDCSVQRRHQKVLEEAPAPGMTAERRQAMGEAAVAAARAVAYVGAGTVEFIVSPDGAFHFMEMNTRLQVEHPVTEMITGTDLVEWQFRIASGEPLPRTQQQLSISGHAIEARLYAENPDRGFLPATGTLRHVRLPESAEFSARYPAIAAEGVRIDSGVCEGDVISPWYDPMIAKLIVWGHDRDQALLRMAHALSECRIVGLATNIDFLRRLVQSPAFAAADLDTGLIERNQGTLFPAREPAAIQVLALAAAALLESERQCAAAGDPWSATTGWRLHARLQRELEFTEEHASHVLTVEYRSSDWVLRQGTASRSSNCGVSCPMMIVAREGDEFRIRLGGQAVHGTVVRDGSTFHIFAGGAHTVLAWTDPMAHAGAGAVEAGRLTAPMPGKIVAVMVQVGMTVEQGAPLLVLEAMKMEHTITAPASGVVEAILYAVGDQVDDGAQLLSIAAGSR